MSLADSESNIAPSYLDRLNAEQRDAVLHGGGTVADPLLVIAGAGSGKTNTLAHRVAHLIVSGADPRRILLMTFSRRAAQEMAKRVERITRQVMGEQAAVLADGLTWAGTFHAIGARLIREYAPVIGLGDTFSIHDRADSADLMNLVRHELGLSHTKKRFPAKSTCLAIYSRVVNAEAELEDVLKTGFPWCLEWTAALKALFAAYVEAKQAQNVLDYDDLLLYWRAMVSEAGLGVEIGGRFDHVLVDEYQDTNRLQAAILTGMKPDGRGLTVVGDDAQSIYSFRGAQVRNILDFPALFSPTARMVTLERNYRSTAPILEAANAVIAQARERHAKDLWTDRSGAAKPRLVTVREENDQAAYVCEQVLAERETGTTLKQQAVLFRASHHSGPLEIELTRRNIPFVKFGGLKFLDAAHVKDTLAILRFADNPQDRVAGFRVLQLIPGVGPSTAGAVMEALAISTDPVAELASFPIAVKTQQDWADFVRLFSDLRTRAGAWPAEIERVRRWYEPHLERRHEDADIRKADLAQLEQIASAAPDRARFLTDLSLDPPDATSDHAGPPLLDEDYLILSTIHSAKGQEWKQVFVLNCVDGCIPSDLAVGTSDEIEEERRLLYVAMTRAKDALHLITPQRFYTHGQRSRGDRHVYASRTRFIDTSSLDRYERCSWPATPRTTEGTGATPQVQPVDLKAKMKGMWR